jgi:hypothetical protein
MRSAWQLEVKAISGGMLGDMKANANGQRWRSYFDWRGPPSYQTR